MGFNKKISRQSKVKFNDINHELEDSVNSDIETRVEQLEDNIENNIYVSGPAAVINEAAPMIVASLIANITAYQEGEGDPAPDNVRAISGFSEVDIVRNGFNQWDEEWEVGIINNITGENVQDSTHIRSKNYISCKPNTNYYFKCGSSIGDLILCFYDINKNFISALNGTAWNYEHTTPNNCYYMRWCNVFASSTTYNHDICINISDTTKNGTYEPYKGEQVAIALGQTVYGGRLDVTIGKLVVNRAMIDLSTVSFTYDSNNKRWYRQISDMKDYSARSTELMFEQYQATSSAYIGDTGTAFAYGKDIYIYDANQSLTISGKCIYELATPTTVQLTPTQIKLLENYNVIMANSGDIELTYQPNNELGKALVPISDLIDTELSLRPILKSASVSGTTSEAGLLATTITGVPLYVDLSDGTDKLTASFLYGEDDVIVIKSEVSTAVTGTLYYL
jgi:hypothetical protein